jgi:hypothetical protein
MSRIEVDITGLQAAGGQAAATGSRVAGLAADCHTGSMCPVED